MVKELEELGGLLSFFCFEKIGEGASRENSYRGYGN